MHFLSIFALLLISCSLSVVAMDQESSDHKKITKSREALLKKSQGEISIDCHYPVSPRNTMQHKTSLGKITVFNTSPQSPRAQITGLPDGKKS